MRRVRQYTTIIASSGQHGDKVCFLVFIFMQILRMLIWYLECNMNITTLQGINISHLGKRNIIFKMPFLGDMLVPWRVHIYIYNIYTYIICHMYALFVFFPCSIGIFDMPKRYRVPGPTVVNRDCFLSGQWPRGSEEAIILMSTDFSQ